MTLRKAPTVFSIFAVLAVLAPTAAAAEFGIVPGSLAIKALDAEGQPEIRAGAHPDHLEVDFNLSMAGTGTAARTFIVELPAGLTGDPGAVPACPRTVFEERAQFCPSDTQIGVLSGANSALDASQDENIYNVEPAPGVQLAEFAASFENLVKVPFEPRLRPDDFGLTLEVNELLEVPFEESRLVLWGIPADHQSQPDPRRLPFVTLPTRCGPLSVTLRTRSWKENAPWLSSTANGTSLSGCQNLPFEPHLGLELSNAATDTPTGMKVSLTFPEYSDPDGVVGAQAKKISIALPEGLSLSPSGATHLGACTDAQLGLGSEAAATCPPSSKIGTVALEGPELTEPLQGKLYLGQELPGNRFRLFVVAARPGAVIKLTGSLRADPESGRLTATLDNLPQLAFTRMDLNIDGGPQGLLATPLSCGTATATATFEPYGGGPSVQSSAAVKVGGSPCSPATFAPEVVAGSTSAKAGGPTSFAVTLRRKDGEQLPDRLSVGLPAGLSPALGTVQTCAAPLAASGDCPAASRIGSAVAELGSGPDPASMTGDVFLTGPYRRAPFGVAIAFHAAIGPFNLGTFVLRAAITVDPLSGDATLETDSLPDAFEGVPLRFQMIGLDLARPGFLRNPTSCAPTKVIATIRAESGVSATSASPFRLKGCDALKFRPTFSIGLRGRSELRRDGRPGLKLTARLPKGSANLRSVDVQLPGLLRFSAADLKEVCARSDAERGDCKKGSRVGVGYARSPLMKKTMKGFVYVVQPHGHGSPDLWTSIEGEGIELDLRSETSEEKGRTTVALTDLPDIPLSTFTLSLEGGDKGVISLRDGLCDGARPRRISSPIATEGQNDARRKMLVPVVADPSCG
jgi:hypothetical protein